MHKLFILIVVGYSFNSFVGSLKGFDTINPISVENFTCFKQHGYEFYIGQIYKSYGEVDSEVIINIKNARQAGFQYVDGYIFPCLLSYCPTAKEQIEESLNFVKKEGGQIGRLWIQIQDAKLYFETVSKIFNQVFIVEAVQQAEAMNVKVGIFTNSTHWNIANGFDWDGVADKPLWLDNNNGKKLSFSLSLFLIYLQYLGFRILKDLVHLVVGKLHP